MINNYESYIQLLEGKNVGIIYHFTSLFNLYNIQKDDYKLKAERTVSRNQNLLKTYKLYDKEDYKFISFSRNKNLHKHSNLLIGSYPSVRITIDGNKLSERYRLPNCPRKLIYQKP